MVVVLAGFTLCDDVACVSVGIETSASPWVCVEFDILELELPLFLFGTQIIRIPRSKSVKSCKGLSSFFSDGRGLS